MENNSGYYKLNNEVLGFDVTKNVNEILFNHYIIKKENLQRLKMNLPRGQFYLTINIVSIDLNITVAIARGLIKKFSELGIITNVYTPPKGCKKPSIWEYNSATFANNDDNNDSNNDINNEEAIKTKGLKGVTNNDINNDANNDVNNSKKEYIKRINKKNIYSHLFDFWIEKDIKNHRGITKDIIKAIDTTLKEYTEEQVKEGITNYNIMYKDENYKWCEHQWGLNEFLLRKDKDGVRQLSMFLNDGSKFVNYKKNKGTKTAENNQDLLELYT